MASLHEQGEVEPLLPVSTTVDMTLADEKADVSPKQDDVAPPPAYRPANSQNKKLDLLKKFFIAVALMMMGASTLKLFQKYTHKHHHHRHGHQFHHNKHGASRHSQMIDYLSSSPLKEGFERPHGKIPSFMHPPRPEACFALKKESVHFNLTVSGFVHSVFLDPSLKDARVDIKSMPSKVNLSDISASHVGAGFVAKEHHDRKHGCTRNKSTILVSAKALSNKNTFAEDGKETYVCSLDLPFGQMGIGLFHGKPSTEKKNWMAPHIEVKHDEPPPPPRGAEESFEPVSIKLKFPPGPYTVTSQPPLPHHFGHRPPPPPPHHKGPGPHRYSHRPKGPHSHHHGHHRVPKNGMRMGCLKKKLIRIWKGIIPGGDMSKSSGLSRGQDVKAAEVILP